MPIATLCRLSQCANRHITRTRHHNRESYRVRRPCAPLANCDYRLLSPSTQDFRCCRTAYWPATQHSSASLLLVKYGNVSTVVLTSLELLFQHLVHIIPRELKLDKKIQNWVRASVCAVCSRQTVTRTTALKRCSIIEIVWYRNLVSRVLPVFSEILLQDHREGDELTC